MVAVGVVTFPGIQLVNIILLQFEGQVSLLVYFVVALRWLGWLWWWRGWGRDSLQILYDSFFLLISRSEEKISFLFKILNYVYGIIC